MPVGESEESREGFPRLAPGPQHCWSLTFDSAPLGLERTWRLSPPSHKTPTPNGHTRAQSARTRRQRAGRVEPERERERRRRWRLERHLDSRQLTSDLGVREVDTRLCSRPHGVRRRPRAFAGSRLTPPLQDNDNDDHDEREGRAGGHEHHTSGSELGRVSGQQGRLDQHPSGRRAQGQIGRASCRERVS